MTEGIRHEVTITLRVTIPGDHQFLNMKAIADDIAGAAFVQLEGFHDDHGLAYENASSSVSVTRFDPERLTDPLAWPHYEIADWLWEDAGEDDDPSGRLLAAIHINRIPFHVEAYALLSKEDPRRENPDFMQEVLHPWDEELDHMFAIAGEAGEPFYTHTIRGREYVLVAYPFYD